MSDLISRQAMIDALKKIMFTHLFECGEYIGEDTREVSIMNAEKALDAIENLPSAEPELRWIPVTEALPKDGERVLTTIEVGSRGKKVRSGTYFKSLFQCDNGDVWTVTDKEVIAWMPLPEPWKGE